MLSVQRALPFSSCPAASCSQCQHATSQPSALSWCQHPVLVHRTPALQLQWCACLQSTVVHLGAQSPAKAMLMRVCMPAEPQSGPNSHSHGTLGGLPIGGPDGIGQPQKVS